MTRTSTAVSTGLTVALLVLALAAEPRATLAFEPSPALKEVIAAAKQEGRLDLQWSSGVMGGAEAAVGLGKGMNAMFGTNIAVNFAPGPPSVPQVLNTISVALAAGRPSPTNLFAGSTELAGLAWNKGILVSVDWKALLPGRIEDRMIEAEGTAIRAYTGIAGGIVYNTKLAPYRPTRLTDLLGPEWKGKIASTPYAASFDLLAASDHWGEEKALDFARKMSKQIQGLIGCPDLERIASGEFIALAPFCSGSYWVKLKRDGAPLDYVVPTDNPLKRYYYLSIPKNAPQPNAAKLFVAYLMTSEGQSILWQADDANLDNFPDSQMAKVIATYENQGVKLRELDIAWFQRHPEVDAMRVKAVKILTER